MCAIVTQILGKKGAIGSTVKLMTGIFLLVTMISPLLKLRIGDVTGYWDGIAADADQVTQSGAADARQTLEGIIKAKAEAYILDKAGVYGAELTVEVSVGGSEVPVPVAVMLRGNISPYGKKQLQTWIRDDLGIPLEAQTWTT